MKEELQYLITFEHVLGARIAQNYLRAKGINAEMDDIPCEGNAKLWVAPDDVNNAYKILEEWKEEIKTRSKIM